MHQIGPVNSVKALILNSCNFATWFITTYSQGWWTYPCKWFLTELWQMVCKTLHVFCNPTLAVVLVVRICNKVSRNILVCSYLEYLKVYIYFWVLWSTKVHKVCNDQLATYILHVLWVYWWLIQLLSCLCLLKVISQILY